MGLPKFYVTGLNKELGDLDIKLSKRIKIKTNEKKFYVSSIKVKK